MSIFELIIITVVIWLLTLLTQLFTLFIVKGSEKVTTHIKEVLNKKEEIKAEIITDEMELDSEVEAENEYYRTRY